MKKGRENTMKTRILAAMFAVIVMCAVGDPAYAQNSGVGGDNLTRLLWRATDGSISLYKIDTNNNVISNHSYGPYQGTLAVAMTVAANNNTYVLWRNTNGSMTLWLVDPNLNFVTNIVSGPFPGWIAEHLSADTGGMSNLRLTWRHTVGEYAVWVVRPDLSVASSVGYGPFFGYLPGE
jgi:hypothetical protein